MAEPSGEISVDGTEVHRSTVPETTDKEIDKLFNAVMKGEWGNVVATYRKSSTAHKTELTKSKETALHLAVADGQTEIAMQLIDAIEEAAVKEKAKADEKEKEKAEAEVKAALGLENVKGDTPLHLAAARGNLEVCIGIVTAYSEGFTARNSKGETPIFLAALYGMNKAFLWLHSTNQDKMHLKRGNGDTILHVAVLGDYFGLAYKIIMYYPEFVNSLNENGLTPLHIIAGKSNAFKSSTSLGLFDRILYYCLAVDEMEETPVNIQQYRKTAKEREGNSERYPKNYHTCIDSLRLLKYPISMANAIFIWHKGEKKGHLADEEDPSKNDNKGKKKNSIDDENIKLEQVSILVQGLDKLKKRSFVPPNYESLVLFFKLIVKALLIIFGVGIWRIRKIERTKKLHLRAKLVMDGLVERTTSYKSYGNTGSTPENEDKDLFIPELVTNKSSESKHGTPILIAAKTGVTEMVEKILNSFPVAINDEDSAGRNVVLLAVEYRQPLVYDLLLKNRKFLKDSVFRHVDNNGNTALHLAAQLGKHKPWLIPGSALQMQWEIKWYEYVRDSIPPNFLPLLNNDEQTPNDVFCDSHGPLIKEGSEWLTKTSESCSVVAALVATVAFTASSTVPGGVNQDSGVPTLKDKPAFNAFAISALVALCFSVTGLVFFLTILTSRYQEKDFASDLPRKLLLGLTSLFASIASMLVSFCSGHIFVLDRELRYVAYPLYAALCFPVTFFAIAQLSLYFDLIMAIFKKVPQRSHRMFPH
ncbi:uncharacterized protein LOC133819805 [Humulus lupulus]|uniref:uncharacterized protein LOC133819805 n=1 Tax=Humulus lupulus TaxID=3486 RepID=UPI002B403288|nr:uncharacterized protein LOC133819805 [Humulus lupulus]